MQNNTFSGLFVGQNVIALQRVDSTNNYLKNELSNSKPIAEGTVIMAEDQFAGRGQFSNSWLSEPGKNLTFSILLYPSFLGPGQLFNLNIAVSIAINDVLTEIIGSKVKIKWPNDIFFENSKLGGILIENSISGSGGLRHSVVGIGLNVNQTDFAGLRSVSSIKAITGTDTDRMALFKKICFGIELRYRELMEDRFNDQFSRYLKRLYRFNEIHTFVVSGELVRGKITGVDQGGRLCMDINGKAESYGLKEIGYVLEEETA